MQESLAVQFRDLQADVGFFLGYGRGADFGQQTWSDEQQADITRAVKGGLRNFYHCGADWSFLHPVVTLTLAEGDTTLAVPDDFGGAEGQLTLSTSADSYYPLDFTGVGTLYQQQARYPSSTGRPQCVAIEPLKGTTQVTGQKFQLLFWPTSDQEYTVQFAYYVNPEYLSGTRPFAYGGPQHAETLLESCLAVAEKILDDAATVHAMEFEKRLLVSMKIDRRNEPQHLGYNGDRSDCRHDYWGRRWEEDQVVTFDGTAYE